MEYALTHSKYHFAAATPADISDGDISDILYS